MNSRFLYVVLCLALAGALLVGLTLPATAQLRSVTISCPDGSTRVVEVPIGVPIEQVPSPCPPPSDPSGPQDVPGDGGGGAGGSGDGDRGRGPEAGPPGSAGEDRPEAEDGDDQRRSGDDSPASTRRRGDRDRTESRRRRERRRRRTGAPQMRRPDGSPAPSNPGFMDTLPGPSTVTGVPNFVIRKFKVPIFLLSIYQAAGIQYNVRWEILAAINEIETDYGRNLNVSSAGAVGWMQFLPSTWKAYGVDANKDGQKDPYNPVDAIFAAARYLKASGAEKDIRRAIFAYNHAQWYVDSVLLRAKLIAGVPGGVVDSLTGLTEGRFPVYARARYADDVSEREAERRVERGQNAARVVEENENRRGIEIYARRGSPVIAVNDGVVRRIGRSKRLGRYVVLQDVYGNQFTYSGLASVSRLHPVPKEDATDRSAEVPSVGANDPKPTTPASAGRQLDDSGTRRPGTDSKSSPSPGTPAKQRLFAHPSRPNSKKAGGIDQMLNSGRGMDGFTTFRNYFSRALGLDARNMRLKRLRRGSRVIGGTILGRVGRHVPRKAAHLYFQIRPAGKGAPTIDPKPILDGWKLLEATAIYRASGRNVLYGEDGMSVGQILLLPKPLLQRRVLNDNRIEIYDCGRQDIRSGQIDRRVLATVAYLAEVGLRPTITSLKCGHSFYTSSGGVSHHSSGNAVDIARINGVPILGHQERGGVTEQTVRRLMGLQGTLRADQIISLLDLGPPTLAMADHADHIHVGFRPLFGSNSRTGQQALAVLRPGQWSDLLERLRQIDNPTVRTRPSRFAIPVRRGRRAGRASRAHRSE